MKDYGLESPFFVSITIVVKPIMTVIAFSYQSYGVDFGEWISLFTLSLAPLITHILTGIPDTIQLYTRPPHWSDRLVHFNPTSILWRYFAILDRRVRSKSWNTADMAASNTLFWTSNGWDGSEEMMVRSRAFCIRLPNHARIDLLSGSTLQTVLVALQGLQALYATRSRTDYSERISLATIFLPVAIFGLLRLPTALWLSSDFAYAEPRSLHVLSHDETHSGDFGEPIPDDVEGQILAPQRTSSVAERPFDPSVSMAKTEQITAMGLHLQLELQSPLASQILPGLKLWSVDTWRGRLVRIMFITPVIAIDGLVMSGFIRIATGKAFLLTATALAVEITYLTFFICTTCIFAVNLITGKSTTTVLPGITSMWYKVYTGVLMIMAIAMIVLASIETRKSSCGVYTALSQNWDAKICPDYTFVQNATMQWNVTYAEQPAIFKIEQLDGFCGGTGHVIRLDL